MHNLEKRTIEKIDDNIRVVSFLNSRKEGINEEKAVESVRKFHPMYGDPKDTSQTTGDNRPLLDELRNRVNAYIEKRSKTDLEEYKKGIEKSTTFNSLIRQEIRKGNKYIDIIANNDKLHIKMFIRFSSFIKRYSK